MKLYKIKTIISNLKKLRHILKYLHLLILKNLMFPLIALNTLILGLSINIYSDNERHKIFIIIIKIIKINITNGMKN